MNIIIILLIFTIIFTGIFAFNIHLLINHFIPDKATGIVYRGELRSNTTTTTTATSTTTSTDIISTSNVVKCDCPCKYGRLNGLDNTSFYKNECFDQWKEFKEWKYFKCFFEKSCSTGNIYRGKISSNSTFSTTTTITSPKANKDFTTKQPEISVGKSETELESSQINDDKELEFVTTSKLKIEKIETPTNFIDENPSITPTSKPEIDFTTDKNNGIYNFINSIQLIK